VVRRRPPSRFRAPLRGEWGRRGEKRGKCPNNKPGGRKNKSESIRGVRNGRKTYGRDEEVLNFHFGGGSVGKHA